jgi:hypothetical protein
MGKNDFSIYPKMPNIASIKKPRHNRGFYLIGAVIKGEYRMPQECSIVILQTLH